MARGQRGRAARYGHAIEPQSHDCLLRSLLRPQVSRRRPLEQRTAFRPVFRQECGEVRPAVKDVTVSTVVGTGVIAAIQGALLGVAFGIAGVPNALFWSVVTIAVAILP